MTSLGRSDPPERCPHRTTSSMCCAPSRLRRSVGKTRDREPKHGGMTLDTHSMDSARASGWTRQASIPLLQGHGSLGDKHIEPFPPPPKDLHNFRSSLYAPVPPPGYARCHGPCCPHNEAFVTRRK